MRRLLFWAAGVAGLPLLGVLASGLPFERYLEFPPKTLYIGYAPFSEPVFIAGALGLLLFLPWYFCGLKGLSLKLRPADAPARDVRRVILAAVLVCICWLVAWSRAPGFESLQPHTFVFLWSAYIYLIHELLIRRTGESPFSGRRRETIGLLLVSSCFWWLFEWLNRFVQNWSYHHVQAFSPFEYWIFATLSFSTVLPAVLGTKTLLCSFLDLKVDSGRAQLQPFSILRHYKSTAALITAASLVIVGIYPSVLFPCLWISPLLLLILFTDEMPPAEIFSWSLAALVCGFFWELWNWKSLAGWEYHIPYVARYYLFEMPALGYAGYLPFGVLCGIVCRSLGWDKRE